MNSNPSFYPKHLAKQYVGLWSLDQARGHGGPLGQPVVVSPALGAPASNVSSNGQRSVTPVGLVGHCVSQVNENKKRPESVAYNKELAKSAP